jgi:hypothetical protein
VLTAVRIGRTRRRRYVPGAKRIPNTSRPHNAGKSGELQALLSTTKLPRQAVTAKSAFCRCRNNNRNSYADDMILVTPVAKKST